ncbi:MAG: branched-chain amino acid ABC transporter substrate-binding protein, partial [Herbaspirillum sp.]
MENANSVEPKKYLPFLAKINYKGVTGPIAFDKFGDMKEGTLTLYTFKNGKRSLLEVTK